jgi:serine/threonine-protein kinase
MQQTATLTDFVAVLRKAGIDESALKLDHRGTMVASLPPSLERMPALTPLTQPGGDIELLAPIGRGGMGVVHLARQRGVSREVAVKQARGGEDGSKRSEALAAELLVEARVTGNLEHPNIIPIYTVGEGEGGELLLVMKRVEGAPWSRQISERRDEPGALEREVRVLIEVAQAAHFAHEKGVIHRDLKPDNVMIGGLDEVYVLDWGLALATKTPAPAGLRVADGTQPIAGTPSYMAPEMAIPFEPLDRRTDVYLLGAILHEIVTGAAPHKGKSIPELLFDAHRAEPPSYDDDVPAELAAICARAMAREPADRFATAHDLRLALEDFLQHASARELAALAEERLASLLALSDDESDDVAAQRAFAEARFGFKQALRAWPDASVEAGMRDAVTCMVERELRRGRADAAALLLEDADVDDGVRARVTLARDARSKRDEELESIARDADITLGARARSLIIFALGVGWLVHQLVLSQAVQRGMVESVELFLALSNGFAVLPLLAVAGGVIFRGGKTNAIDRKFYVLTCTSQAVSALVFVIAWLAPFSYAYGLAIVHMTGTLGIVAGGVLDKRVMRGLIGAVPGIPLIALFPAYALELNGVLMFVTFTFIAKAMSSLLLDR